MKSHNLQLHHCAKQITRESLDFVLALFGQMGCRVSYREDGATWAMIDQDGLAFDIQFIERDREPIPLELKRENHVAFISSKPAQEIERLKQWVETQGRPFVAGSWSDREQYFDCPNAFVDFVVEVMHRSVVE